MVPFERAWNRPVPTPRQRTVDLWFGAGAAVVSVGSLELWRSLRNVEISGPDWIMYALFAVVGGVLAVRRTLPLTVLLVEAVLFIVIGEMQAEFSAVFTVQMAMFMALYTAWAWSRRERDLYVVSGLVVAAMFIWLLWLFVEQRPDEQVEVLGLVDPYVASVVYSLAINVVYFFGAIAWGHVAWSRARERAALDDQHDRERQAQVVEREAAIRAERVRIARDLHDVVAHHVSGIGVQASGAARILESQPKVAREALTRIESSSRTAVAQMHQLVGLLRDHGDDRDAAPQPRLDDLHRLATDETRPAITFQQVGEPFEVSSTVQVSLVRIAQEAVANIRRHATAAHQGSITLRYLGDETEPSVELEVLDDGRDAHDDADDGGGFGLSGIRERVAMHGGICEVGPRPTGGFRVRVRVPA